MGNHAGWLVYSTAEDATKNDIFVTIHTSYAFLVVVVVAVAASQTDTVLISLTHCTAAPWMLSLYLSMHCDQVQSHMICGALVPSFVCQVGNFNKLNIFE